MTQKAIKGSVLSDYLAHQPVDGYQPIKFDFPDEDIMFIRDFNIPGPGEGPEPGARWTLMLDGAYNTKGYGIEAVITSPTGFHYPFTAKLCFDCTNNMAEYEACISDIEVFIDLRIKILKVFGDSALVISQVRGVWETRDKKLILEENQLADALATLSSMFKVKWKNEAPVIRIDHLDEPAHCLAMEAECDDNPWFYDIKRYLERREYPEKESIIDKKALRRFFSKFFLNGDVLYKRNYDFVLLRCVDRHEESMTIRSIHEGCEGVHAKGPVMAKDILRAGYCCTIMEVDCYNLVKRCPKFQIFGDKIHVPPTPLQCLDLSLAFLHVGIPSKIITNNSSNLNNKVMSELCHEFKIGHHNSSSYRPKMNDVIEEANKNIKRIIQKMVKTYMDWHEMLPFSLQGYGYSLRTSTWATPYFLVYGMEVVLPIKVEIPSLRVIMEADLDEAEWE
ncbi:uncharacterized protein LOC127104522 [Lathyrus oleraceus]|uniref:uncharacterized protein LOC127104522 n=1 Tax=Pisum sativum TaxID=3888 RepID=UPI0021CE2C14|nr:uncharacterized protein LOC127104522 [Pisum sativum]